MSFRADPDVGVADWSLAAALLADDRYAAWRVDR